MHSTISSHLNLNGGCVHIARQQSFDGALGGLDLSVFEASQADSSGQGGDQQYLPAGAETLIDSIVAGFHYG